MNITNSGKLDHQAYLRMANRFAGRDGLPPTRPEAGTEKAAHEGGQWRPTNRLARYEPGESVRARPPFSAQTGQSAAPVSSDGGEQAREAARRAEIVRRRESGESLAKLAKRFRSTPARISRVVAQEQFKRVQELQLDYIPNDRFKRMSGAAAEGGSRPGARESPSGQGRSSSSWVAPLSGEHVRDATADPRAGAAHVSQDELLEAQGERASRTARPAAAQSHGDDANRTVGRRRCRDEERHYAGEPPLGGLHRQALRHWAGPFVRIDQRRQHVADSGRGKVRLRPRLPLQHLRLVGDHEELRPHDPGGASAAGSLPHRRRRAVDGHGRRARRIDAAGGRATWSAKRKSRGSSSISTSASGRSFGTASVLTAAAVR